MRWRLAQVIAVAAFGAAACFWAPPVVQAAQVSEHEHHPEATLAAGQSHTGVDHRAGSMMTPDARHIAMASDAKFDALVKKMNEATGQAKVDAMAELLTALVQDRRMMHTHMMASMQPMMKEMCHGDAQPVEPKK